MGSTKASHFEIIISPLITEKTASISTGGANKAAFKVRREASKHEIKQAVEKIFDVKVLQVRTINCQGRRKNRGFSIVGKRGSWKKAYVTLAPGSAINVIEGL